MNSYFSLRNIFVKKAMPAMPGENEGNIPENVPQPQLPAQEPIQPQEPQQPQQPVNQQNNIQPNNQANPIQGNKPIQFIEEKQWGQWKNIIVSIPQFTKEDKTSLDKAAIDYIESHKDEKGNYPAWATWNNKYKKNRLEIAPFKLFSGVKERQNCYSITVSEPDFFHVALEKLNGMGFDTNQIAKFQQAPHAEENAEQAIQNKEVKVNVPDWNIIQLKFSRDDEITKYIRENRVGGRWNPQQFCWDFNNSLPARLKTLSDFMQKQGFSVEEFNQAIDTYDKKLEDNKINMRDPNKKVVAEDVSDNCRFLISVQYPKGRELFEEMHDFVQFSFPSLGHQTEDMKLPLQPQQQLPGQEAAQPQEQKRIKPTGMRVEKNGRSYLFGTFDDFIRFGNLLKNSKWDVDGYRTVLAKLVRDKKIEKTRFSGELDGYLAKGEDGKQLRDKNGNPLYDVDKFYSDLDTLVTGGTLLPKQKQGVAWLYSRQSAILGDKAGTGKTLETIAAAGMRMKQSGGRTLVMVLKNTKQQWMSEIQKWLGPGEENQVSDDPSSDARWVVVSYSSIAAIPVRDPLGDIRRLPNGAPLLAPKKRKAQDLINRLFDAKFTCLIMDEAHVLKNESAGMARILSFLNPNIPFKWGATATPAANTAQDVHNVLSLTGHPLGELSPKKFNEEFVGAKMNLKNMGDADAILAQEKGAYNLRKWLTLSGAFLSRSMKAMNENLPPHEIGELEVPEVNFDMEAFARDFQNKLNTYKSKGPALCAMTAQRTTLAMMKVPHTLAEAKKILGEGKRILIFSCFRQPCKALVDGLNMYFKEMDPEAKVVSIIDGDNTERIQGSIKYFKDPESNAKAMVIASLKGGTGVSLENSTQDVLMNDFDWTPRVTEQTEGRAYRINNVIPVNTRYTVIKGKGTPDELFYNYVRAKIKLSGIIQNLDSESEEYLLKGLDDTEIQEKIMEARAQDRQVNENLAHDLDDIMKQYGINIFGEEQGGADKVGNDLNLDDAYEEQQLRGDNEEGGQDNPVQASGWYSLLKTY